MAKKFDLSKSWEYFCDSTSIHGLVYIHRVKNILVKLFWIVCWFLMLSFILYFSTKSIIQYVRFDVNTKMVYETLEEIEFPAITFCNQFALRTIVRNEPAVFLAAVASYSPKLEYMPKIMKEVGFRLISFIFTT